MLLLQVLEEIYNLRLDGHVQGCHRLVRHQQLRLHRQRPCNRHPLPLPAGQLCRVFVQASGVQSHIVHLEFRLRPQGTAGRGDFLELQRLGNDIAHRHALVQAGVGVLKNQLAGGLEHPPVGPESSGVAGVDSFIQNTAAIGPVYVHDAAGRGGFPGAGLPHQTENLPPPQLEGHVVHRLDCNFFGQGEHVGQMPHVQQNFLRHSPHLPPAAQWQARACPAARWLRNGCL